MEKLLLTIEVMVVIAWELQLLSVRTTATKHPNNWCFRAKAAVTSVWSMEQELTCSQWWQRLAEIFLGLLWDFNKIFTPYTHLVPDFLFKIFIVVLTYISLRFKIVGAYSNNHKSGSPYL